MNHYATIFYDIKQTVPPLGAQQPATESFGALHSCSHFRMQREKVEGGAKGPEKHPSHKFILIRQGLEERAMNRQEIPLSASRPYHVKRHDV